MADNNDITNIAHSELRKLKIGISLNFGHLHICNAHHYISIIYVENVNFFYAQLCLVKRLPKT